MKILDLYIIKKYIGTFFIMLGLFIPIGIMVDIAEKIDKFRENEVPLKRVGSPEDMASTISFLAGQDSSYITGAIIHVNGGLYLP